MIVWGYAIIVSNLAMLGYIVINARWANRPRRLALVTVAYVPVVLLCAVLAAVPRSGVGTVMRIAGTAGVASGGVIGLVGGSVMRRGATRRSGRDGSG